MKRSDLTEKLLDIKREKGWSWKHICAEIGGMSPVLVTGALLGNHKLTKPQAAAAAAIGFVIFCWPSTAPVTITGDMPPISPQMYFQLQPFSRLMSRSFSVSAARFMAVLPGFRRRARTRPAVTDFR